VVGTIKDFFTDSTDPEDWTFPDRYRIKRELLRTMAPNGLFAHCAMLQAIEDAKLTTPISRTARRDSTPLRAARPTSPTITTSGWPSRRDAVFAARDRGVDRRHPEFQPRRGLQDSGRIVRLLVGLRLVGPRLGFALDDLTLGRQQRMFVVGAEDGNTDAILPFAGMRTLSLQTDPNLASRPFDAARDGFVGTGGGTASCWKPRPKSPAAASRPTPKCSAGGRRPTDTTSQFPTRKAPVPRRDDPRPAGRGRGARRTVDYVNAHATSTLIGDVSEARALRSVFQMPHRPGRRQQHQGAHRPRPFAGRRDGERVLRAGDARRFHPRQRPPQHRRSRVRRPEYSARHRERAPRHRDQEQQRLWRRQRGAGLPALT
jgi:3-oxoacyl-[acyl-carrier-protein] synthase-1